MTVTIGSKLGPYEILSKLGEGGMGEVYRARDARLNRDVAIKVLPAAFAADPDRLRRFEQEARSIAALNHPHICQIYDVGPSYLVLEYVAGEAPQGPMPPDDAVRLAIQLASALEAAHEQGILHRDLKPSNVIVDARSGKGKLLDFGLAQTAKADADVTRTSEGVVVGTAAYMSPEQAEGLPLDARSDVFAFGSVLYELIVGRRAFAGTTSMQVLDGVRRGEPQPFSGPVPIDRVVRRCLAKRPDDRFQTMTAVRHALEDAAGALVSAGAADAKPSIVVLPFANMSAGPENEYFSDGLAEEIINALTHVPGLKVIARTSAFAFKGRNEDVRRIAEALGVAHVLEGSVRKSGNRVRITAQLITASDGSHLWSERYDREMADIFEIQDDISQAIASALRVTLAVKPTQGRHAPKLPAYEQVLKGRHHMLRHKPESFPRANACFEQAMTLDPQYAEPHASLGWSYFLSAMLGMRSPRETMPLIRVEAKEALSLDPSDPGPHSLLASVAAAYEYDWPAANEHFAIGLAASSVPAEAYWAYASLYLQPLGRFEEAVTAMERSVERDPVNAHWRAVLASHLTHAGRAEDAVRPANEAMELDETSYAPYVTLSEACISMGRWEDAAAAAEKGHQLYPQDALAADMLAGALVNLGDRTSAEALIREMGDGPRPIFGRALYHLLCNDVDEAADWYERAINGRDPFALVFANGPMGSALRQSSRWPKLARMMNLPA
jgi:eukaryotic-like serine/threonine-protein kinase